MVSVDVKHHVYERASTRKATDSLRSLPNSIRFFPAWQWDSPNYNRDMDRHFSSFFVWYQIVWTKWTGLDCASESLTLQVDAKERTLQDRKSPKITTPRAANLKMRGRLKLQALVYDILPSTTAVFSYAIGSRKLSANEHFLLVVLKQ